MPTIRLGRLVVYLAGALDAYSKTIGGWHLSRGLDRQLTIAVMQVALVIYPGPELHHSDQGGRHASWRYTSMLPMTSRIIMSAAGRPTENGMVERFIRTFKEEHIDYTE